MEDDIHFVIINCEKRGIISNHNITDYIYCNALQPGRAKRIEHERARSIMDRLMTNMRVMVNSAQSSMVIREITAALQLKIIEEASWGMSACTTHRHTLRYCNAVQVKQTEEVYRQSLLRSSPPALRRKIYYYYHSI